jgi:pyruvate dehydrogenase E2 component (dihydrolipoyllysine-residue acetyltransferase)
MMVTVKLPKLGELAEMAVLLEWRCAPGDVVVEGQALAEMETDKVTTDLPSPVAGKVVELLAGIDDEMTVGDPLVRIDTA